jgi:hypothetical protein
MKKILLAFVIFNFIQFGFSQLLLKPYLFYFQVPKGVHVVSPEGLNVKVFTTGTNDENFSYFWICLYADTTENNEMAFVYWMRALYENAPSELKPYMIFEEVGNNTTSARYDTIRYNLQELGF